MTTKRIFVVLPVVLALVAGGTGCGSTSKTTSTSIVEVNGTTVDASEAAESAQKWAGTWNSNFGEMQLTADGAKVSGTYEYCGGKIEGLVAGNTFAGRWEETPGSPDCKRGDVQGTGTFEFTLSADGTSFTGGWKYDNGSTDPNSSTWRGEKQ